MSAFNLTDTEALKLWNRHKPNYLGRVSEMVGLVPTAAIVDWLVGEMVQLAIREAPRAWAWFSRRAAAVRERLKAAADRLDDKLTWHRIANEDLRELFEANDDLWDLFKGGLGLLLQIIEKDVAIEETKAGLKLLEADGLAGFFQKAPLSPEVRVDRTQLPAVRDPIGSTASHQQAAQLIAERRRREHAEKRVAVLEQRLAALNPEPVTIDLEPEPVVIDLEPEPEPEEDPADLLSAGAMSLPTVDPAPLAPEDVPEPSAAAAVKRLKPAKGADTSTRRTAHSVQVSAPVTRRTRKRTK